MFLKLTLYDEDPNLRVPIMVNMDTVIGYTDYYNAEYTRDPISQVRRLKKERVCTYIYTGIAEKSYKGIQVCETMEEINLKMAQLERRNNDNSNRKR